MEGSRLTGEHKDGRADDSADTKRDQVDWSERPLEGIFSNFVGFAGQYRKGLGCQKSWHRVEVFLLDVLYRFPGSMSRGKAFRKMRLRRTGLERNLPARPQDGQR